MTERMRDPQVAGSNHEVSDLNGLDTSKSKQALRAENAQAANMDLASASIQSTSVVRLSARPERRKLAPLTLTTSEELSKSSDAKKATSSRPCGNKKFGVFNNPFYKYEGNILERMITLLANLLKVLEINLLQALKPQPSIPHKNAPIMKPKRRGPDGREIEEEFERDPSTANEREPDPLKQHLE